MAHKAAIETFPTSEPIESLIGVDQAARLLGISPKTLRDWIQARKIEYVKVGTRVLFRPSGIRQFIAANTRRPAS
jgi:excisionase family DNA binding protein